MALITEAYAFPSALCGVVNGLSSSQGQDLKRSDHIWQTQGKVETQRDQA